MPHILQTLLLFLLCSCLHAYYGTTNPTTCGFGGSDQTCSSDWLILSTIVFDSVQDTLTQQATSFLENVTCNCHNSSIKLYLPGWGVNGTEREVGADSQKMLSSINSSLTTVNSSSTASTVLISFLNQMVNQTSELANEVVFVFTNLDCDDISSSSLYDIASNFSQKSLLQFFFMNNSSSICNISSCTAPNCGIANGVLPPYTKFTICPGYSMGSTIDTSTITPTPKTTTPGFALTPLELGLIIGIPCLSLVLLCGICACCCCKCMQVQQMKMKLFHSDPESNQRFRNFFQEMRDRRKFFSSPPPVDPCTGQVPSLAVSNHYMDIEQLAARNKKDDWEFVLKNLLIHENEVLGAGAFATVYRCTVIGKVPLLKAVSGASAALENQDGRTEAAVKRLPPHADDHNRKDFFHEMEFMKRLGYHVHTIAMLGCVSDMWDPLIVVEYCHYGDLLRFIRSRRSDFFGNGSSSNTEKPDRLNIKQLVSFAWQISDGMTYLASRNFVHRDLAARNVLITKNLVAKVSDFGLCRYTDEALYTAKGGKLPIKWMSPEALKFGEFSVKSDVWSFGVLLWEIFSLGETPYNAVQPTEMLVYLEDGNRLSRPQFCPHEIYQVAQNAWHENVEKRPTFDEIRSTLTVMLNLNDESYGYLTVVKKEPDLKTCEIDEPTVLKF